MQRFDNSVDNALDRGVQGVEDAPDDVARFAGDQVRHVAAFFAPDLFPRFGLPARLPVDHPVPGRR